MTNLWNRTPQTKACDTEPGVRKYIRQKLKQNSSVEQPLDKKTLGTKLMDSTLGTRPYDQNCVGQKLTAKPWAELSARASEDESAGSTTQRARLR